MPRTVLSRLPAGRTGAELVLTAVDAAVSPNGMSFPSDGSELIVIKNADAVPHTMTVAVADAARPDGLAVTGKVVTVPAGKTYYAGPWTGAYRQADGSVYLNFDAATSMTVGVIDIPS